MSEYLLFVDVCRNSDSDAAMSICVMSLLHPMQAVVCESRQGTGEDLVELLHQVVQKWQPQRVVLDVPEDFVYLLKSYRYIFPKGTEVCKVHRVSI